MRYVTTALLLVFFSVTMLTADGPVKQLEELPEQGATQSAPWWPSNGTDSKVIDLIAANGGPIHDTGFLWLGPWEVHEWARATLGMLYDEDAYPETYDAAQCQIYW